MDVSELDLPSNRKFGALFTAIFTLGAAYFFAKGSYEFGAAIFVGAAGTGLITLLKDDLLALPNRMWMQLGLILGRIVSPIVLGILFFGILTPVSMLTRLIGRDELRLKPSSQSSYWKPADQNTDNAGFRQQF